jgi:hypothetical protein
VLRVVPSLIRLTQLEEGERRVAPRYLVPRHEPLVAGVAVIGAGGKPRTLTGRVRDLSETGLALLLPRGETCRELTERGLPLAVVVTLPSGVVRLRAEVAHCSTRRGRWGGFLVGVRIAEIAAEDFDRLVEYIGGRS